MRQGIPGPILEAFESVASLFELGSRFAFQSSSLAQTPTVREMYFLGAYVIDGSCTCS